jgi:hypothetical protein
MMKSRLKSLVSAGESTGQGPQGTNSTTHDLELLARFQDYPRQELGSNQFYNKFQSGFSASLLQVLNTSNSYNSTDQKGGDHGPTLGIQQLSSEQYNSDMKRFSTDREDLSSKVRSESRPFLGALGPLSRGTQGVDPNPFLGALGPLSRGTQGVDPNPFLGALGPLSRGTQGVDPNPFLGALGPLSRGTQGVDPNPFLGALGPLSRGTQGVDPNPFLGALGPLSRGTQGVDPNPFLGALGSLRNSHRNDSLPFNHNHDGQNANFSTSASSSFFLEAL